MEEDYFSVEAILAENQVGRILDERDTEPHRRLQKIQCTFKQDLPDLGHLGGGSERDVRVSQFTLVLTFVCVFRSQIKTLSKLPIPLWLAYTILYSSAQLPPGHIVISQMP